jgi:hypothetical protein
MMYVDAAKVLAKSFFHDGQIDAAKEWIEIAITNVLQLRGDYQGEERILINMLQKIADLDRVINDGRPKLPMDNFRHFAARPSDGPLR